MHEVGDANFWRQGRMSGSGSTVCLMSSPDACQQHARRGPSGAGGTCVTSVRLLTCTERDCEATEAQLRALWSMLAHCRCQTWSRRKTAALSMLLKFCPEL